MKLKCLFAGLIIGALIAFGIYYFKRHITHDYNQTIAEYDLRVDSLLTALNQVEVQIDTVEVYIEKIVLQKVVVFEKIKTMPAVNQVALFDSITGDFEPSRIMDSLVITPIQRITKSLEVMVTADLLLQENQLLYQKADLQGQKIETLVKINKENNEIIYFQNLEISRLDERVEKSTELNKWLAGGVGALVLILLIK